MKLGILKYNFWTSIVLIFFSAFPASCNTDNHRTAEQAKPKEVWTCSMHPEVIRSGPGTCPICGMDLIKKEEKAVALKGIEINDLLRPSNQFVISSIPVAGLHKEDKPIPVDALGSVSYDTKYINMISARVSGRIEKLYVRYRYQHIHIGDPIMDIYSPELATAQQELLFLIKNDQANEGLIEAAKQKLLLLGMNKKQLNDVISSGKPSATVRIFSNHDGHIHEAGNTMPGESVTAESGTAPATMEELPVKEGMYVQKGQNVFQLFNTDHIWVLLNIFPESQGIVKVGNPVTIIPETNPTTSIEGKIDFIEPVYRPGSKTVTARVYLKNFSSMMPVGTQVRARIFTSNKMADWLPKEAVYTLGMDNVVFLKVSGGFQAHRVVTGLTYNDQIQIISGLNETDSVAANGQYLADSESFIKTNQ